MATSKSYRSLSAVSSSTSYGNEKTSGLLTTVADLPYNFKIQYVSVETPLDLTVKPTILGQITPPHSPQRSPLKKRPYHHLLEAIASTECTAAVAATTSKDSEPNSTDIIGQPSKLAKKEVTPNGKQVKVTAMPRAHKSATSSGATAPSKEHKRVKAVRKLKFDEKKSSPVSGTIIRALEEIDDNIPHESGDIDPQYNIVEVTDEAKAEIAAIPNVIGAYSCKLCQIEFDDAFGLARHRCSCIVLLEYRCPECGKRFNCPANLASHRRWHKPKEEVNKKSTDATESDENAVQFPCDLCGKFFKRQAYLRKHLATHNKTTANSNSKTPTKRRAGNSVSDDNERMATAASSRKSVCSDDSVSSSASQESMASSSAQFSISTDDRARTNSEHSTEPSHFRLFKSEIFTEEENMAAAALAHLRHSQDSVIRHTQALSTWKWVIEWNVEPLPWTIHVALVHFNRQRECFFGHVKIKFTVSRLLFIFSVFLHEERFYLQPIFIYLHFFFSFLYK